MFCAQEDFRAEVFGSLGFGFGVWEFRVCKGHAGITWPVASGCQFLLLEGPRGLRR